MDFHQDIVLVFTRYPAPGASKTRLIPALGEEGAANLQKKLTEHVVAQTCHLQSDIPCDLEIHYAGGNLAAMQKWLGIKITYKPQAEGDIGMKMAQAMAAHLEKKSRILLLGSDLPEISSSILAEAFGSLKQHDLTIGPAFDGGYYLIGVNGGLKKQTLFSLFANISWGADNVFTETLANAEHHHLSLYILPKLHDIDRPEDLGYLNNHSDPQ